MHSLIPGSLFLLLQEGLMLWAGHAAIIRSLNP